MADGDTLFIVESGVATPIERLPRSHRTFNEAWVRDLIFDTPVLLPTDNVQYDAGAFVPIGIEVSIGHAGKSDVFGVTTGGYPVVVETKLWRNPESRREVLAQTIDYVKEVAKLDYNWFEELWQARRQTGQPETLVGMVTSHEECDLDEAAFIDRVSRACQRGNVLGFMVGDGIQHGLGELVDHLARDSSHLQHSLALLELRCFELADGQLAVMPSIMRKIIPVERTYIRIEAATTLADHLQITSISQRKEDTGAQGKRTTLSEDEFWEALRSTIDAGLADRVKNFLEEVQDAAAAELHYKQRDVMVKIPDPDDMGPPASVLAITSDGYVYNPKIGIGRAAKWSIGRNRANQIYSDYFKRLHRICDSLPLDGVSHLQRNRFVPIAAITDSLDEVSVAIDDVANALRAECGEGDE